MQPPSPPGPHLTQPVLPVSTAKAQLIVVPSPEETHRAIESLLENLEQRGWTWTIKGPMGRGLTQTCDTGALNKAIAGTRPLLSSC